MESCLIEGIPANNQMIPVIVWLEINIYKIGISIFMVVLFGKDDSDIGARYLSERHFLTTVYLTSC